MVLATAPTGPVSPGPGPSAAPSGLNTVTYGTPKKVRVRWTNGDATAYTRVYSEPGGCPVSSPALDATLNPGVTSWDSPYLDSGQVRGFIARHYKNGQESGSSNCATGGTLP